MENIKLNIVDLGDGCDGISFQDDKKIFVPFTLPNEEVEVEKTKFGYKLINLLKKSDKRQNPLCPYFTKCGGCCAQHLNAEFYDNYKNQILNNALKHKNLTSNIINPLKKVGLNQRRRVSFSYKNFGDNFVFGFKEAGTVYTVNIPNCILLVDELNVIIEPTKQLLKSITKKGETGFVNITVCDNGLDFVWSPHHIPNIDFELTEKFQEFANANNVIQITRAGKEIIHISKEPIINFDGVKLPFPAGAFLQPSIQGENLLKEEVINFVKKHINKDEQIKRPRQVADLFCGLGTFTIPLLQFGEVVSYDIFSPSVEKLKEHGKGQIHAISQNLFEEPVKTDELNQFDCVILDPPRSGADTQCRELGTSKTPLIIYISCDPSTFARDAKTLTDNGYMLEEITPVDQFPYTNHLEIVAVFKR